MTRRNKWLIGAGVAATAGAVSLIVAGAVLSRRFEPFIREQAVAYLRDRFQSDVQLDSLKIRMPKMSTLDVLLRKGRGATVRVEGEGIAMRQRAHPELPPLFKMRRFAFDVDLGMLYEQWKVVPVVTVEGLEVQVPPKEQRPRMPAASGEASSSPRVEFGEVQIRDAALVILPRDRDKTPLRFQIATMRMHSTGVGRSMRFEAELTNPKPPGRVRASGTFGPWQAETPAQTELSGEYSFENADLGVFNGIAGKLNSTGQFDGSLSAIHARGQASVPDFRLKRSGQPVPLKTEFEVLVDGTNGNTVLQPVRAVLGRTYFTTTGAVVKHEQKRRRLVRLEVHMPRGDMRDLLRLATKGAPFLEGQIALHTNIDIPPLSGKVVEKLLLDGRFELSNARFLKSTIQDQIDQLSRRGQGQPKNQEIDEVVSGMKGRFRLENEALTFRSLSFGVPGAAVDLAGIYDLDDDVVDFRGSLKLDAKVSQTMTGWKRWALKPADPFFAKNGAGTFLKIRVDGTSRAPKFGLDRGPRDEGERARKQDAPQR